MNEPIYDIRDDSEVSMTERWKLVITGHGHITILVAPGFKFGIAAATEVALAARHMMFKMEQAIKETSDALYGPDGTVH